MWKSAAKSNELKEVAPLAKADNDINELMEKIPQL